MQEGLGRYLLRSVTGQFKTDSLNRLRHEKRKRENSPDGGDVKSRFWFISRTLGSVRTRHKILLVQSCVARRPQHGRMRTRLCGRNEKMRTGGRLGRCGLVAAGLKQERSVGLRGGSRFLKKARLRRGKYGGEANGRADDRLIHVKDVVDDSKLSTQTMRIAAMPGQHARAGSLRTIRQWSNDIGR